MISLLKTTWILGFFSIWSFACGMAEIKDKRTILMPTNGNDSSGFAVKLSFNSDKQLRARADLAIAICPTDNQNCEDKTTLSISQAICKEGGYNTLLGYTTGIKRVSTYFVDATDQQINRPYGMWFCKLQNNNNASYCQWTYKVISENETEHFQSIFCD